MMTFFIIIKDGAIVRTQYSVDNPSLETGESVIEMPEKFDISNCAVVDGYVVGDITARTQMLQNIKRRQRKAEIEQMAIQAAVALLSPEIQAEYSELEG